MVTLVNAAKATVNKVVKPLKLIASVYLCPTLQHSCENMKIRVHLSGDYLLNSKIYKYTDCRNYTHATALFPTQRIICQFFYSYMPGNHSSLWNESKPPGFWIHPDEQ
jgi:hypothetical protein